MEIVEIDGMFPNANGNTSVEIKVWAKRGGMMINTQYLPADDVDHPYNQIKEQGFDPEEFGVFHPQTVEFAGKSRGELIQEIIDLRSELRAYVMGHQ